MIDQNNNIVEIYLDDSDGHQKCKFCHDIIIEAFQDQRHLCRERSEYLEIRRTKDGRMFAIKNIRQEFEGNTITFKADIGGDLEAGNEYLKAMAEGISKQFITQHSQPKVEGEK